MYVSYMKPFHWPCQLWSQQLDTTYQFPNLVINHIIWKNSRGEFSTRIMESENKFAASAQLA